MIPFPKTHDLSVALKLAVAVEPGWVVFLGPLVTITDWAVLARYPGTWASRPDAGEAVRICRQFRTAARAALGL